MIFEKWPLDWKPFLLEVNTRVLRQLESFEYWKLVRAEYPYTYTHHDAVKVKMEIDIVMNEGVDVIWKKPSAWQRLVWKLGGYRVNAYTIRKRKGKIYYYAPSKSLTVNDAASTIIHELAHLAGYHHGSNKPHQAWHSSVPVVMAKISDSIV